MNHYTRNHIPAFGSWDCNDDLPFTQCFESARQAGLIRCSYSGDRDLYVAGDLYENNILTPAIIVAPRRRGCPKKTKKDVWVAYDYDSKEPPSPVSVATQPSPPRPRTAHVKPKPVDEDLYKISPELLRAKPRRVPRALVTCRSKIGDETKNVPLYYHMFDNFQIKFGREEFCLVTGLKFGVEYWADYDDEDQPIPFRRRMFLSSLDSKHMTGKNLVLLGVKDRRAVPNWILRLANDRDGWDDYLWGSYVWPTLYYQLRDANVRCWLPLYATEPTNEVDKKTYSILGFTWALKGRVLAERLIPDEIEAGSGWWVSSRAYFDGRVSEAERPPRHLNRQNHYEVPSEFYRDFQEQRSGLDQMMKQGQNIFEKMNKFMEDMSVGTGANKEPIIVDQHYGISDLSGFQSIQGGPSSFQTPTNNSFFTLTIWYANNWQTPRPSATRSSKYGKAYAESYTQLPFGNTRYPVASM
ncbi:hypothetical protein Tco_1401495 [Tanacetum coccineum]